jgi:hypothetical protein
MIASLSSYLKVPDEEPLGTEASGAEKRGVINCGTELSRACT